MTQFFPGLLRHLREQGVCPSTVRLDWHEYDMLPFREQHHDAIELGHEYLVVAEEADGSPRETHGPGYLPLGYDALVTARGNLSRATHVGGAQ